MGSRTCPDCRETIKAGAIVCKHCGRRFSVEEANAHQGHGSTVILVGVAAIIIMVGISSLTEGSGSDAVAPAAVAEPKKHIPTIVPGAISLMTRDQYPKMHARLGDAAFKRANDKTPAAAESMAAKPNCDALEIIGVSDKSTPETIRWFGDCSNRSRHVVSEKVLDIP